MLSILVFKLPTEKTVWQKWPKMPILHIGVDLKLEIPYLYLKEICENKFHPVLTYMLVLHLPC